MRESDFGRKVLPMPSESMNEITQVLQAIKEWRRPGLGRVVAAGLQRTAPAGGGANGRGSCGPDFAGHGPGA